MLFHKHKFQKDEKRGILWCECGEIKILPKEFCGHKWKIHKSMEMTETNRITNTTNEFTIDTLFCEKCGKIKFINITKGKEIEKKEF